MIPFSTRSFRFHKLRTLSKFSICFSSVRRQLSEELQGQEVNLESVKMHLLPLLSDNPKRILSDKESVLLDDIASASYSEKLNHADSIASVFINEMALAERSDSHCDEYGSHSDVNIVQQHVGK